MAGSISEWDMVDDTTTVTSVQHAPGAVTKVDAGLLSAIFPGKDPAKIASWVAVLQGEEIETVEDSAGLLDEAHKDEWNQLPLPVAVRATLWGRFKEILEAKTRTKEFVASQAQGTATAEAAGEEPQEDAIQQLDCIVLDVSGSMKSRSAMDRLKTREDISKMVFHTMVDRILCLEMHHALCLISFGQRIDVVKDVTKAYEDFHDEMGRLDAGQGSTKLYDAIEAAAEQLIRFAEDNKHRLVPDCPLRIFALTDGEDNASKLAAWQVTRRLQQLGIVLDALPLGNPNATLQAMSTATTGYCLDVAEEQQAIQLFEREGLLHVASRDADERKAKPLVGSVEELNAYVCKSRVVRDVGSAQPKALLGAKTLKSDDDVRKAAEKQQKEKGGLSVRRIMKEYETAVNECDGTFSVHIAESDIAQWKVLIRSPVDSVYKGAWFGATFQFPSNYPHAPPKFRFATRIYHCNINNDGAVCLDILKECWSPALTATRIIKSVQALMGSPNPDDPLDAWKGQQYKSDPARYEAEAVAETAKSAFTTKEEALVALGINQ